jgi:hypothetical protein
MVKTCPMLVKHHGFFKMIVLSLDGTYHQMAKQFQENFKVKVFFENSIANITNYLHETEYSKVSYGKNNNNNNYYYY